ncbi:hypothetical protein RJ639_009950 [Escallonia herrerae]|uniref:DUF7356 domain-containing protein n=1 Tax=Escallonia herrerae TaxID=1293975 RepID=A0AA88VVG5_9ASTE|nr:hypothetical protein RJ639_009950 [Escallonia herrerae]
MIYRATMFMTLFLISLVPVQSDAPVNLNPKVESLKMAPSPSPAAAAGNSPTVQPDMCEAACKRCRDGSVTACLSHPITGSEGSILYVRNDGESSLKANVTTLPLNITIVEIDVLKHQTEKVDISVGGSLAISINAGLKGVCVIHMEAPVSPDSFPSYVTYLTPLNGTYVLFVAALVMGGIWACFKFGKRRRHLDGVPYQELEMGRPEFLSSVNGNGETPEGWDQGWDDDWDEEKAVKSSGTNHVGSRPANGLTSRSSNSDGWENVWDD